LPDATTGDVRDRATRFCGRATLRDANPVARAEVGVVARVPRRAGLGRAFARTGRAAVVLGAAVAVAARADVGLMRAARWFGAGIG